MKIGKKRLKMSSGEIRVFKSETARDNFERTAQMFKHKKKVGKKARGIFKRSQDKS